MFGKLVEEESITHPGEDKPAREQFSRRKLLKSATSISASVAGVSVIGSGASAAKKVINVNSADGEEQRNALVKHVVDIQRAASRACLSASSPGFL